MPLLDEADLQRLRETPPKRCDNCTAMLRKNYCRECDEFFWGGHTEDCPVPSISEDFITSHLGHRITFVISREQEEKRLAPERQAEVRARLEVHPPGECKHCDGDIRRNYCERHETGFWDGHAEDCIAHVVDRDLFDYHLECPCTLRVPYRPRFDADKIIC